MARAERTPLSEVTAILQRNAQLAAADSESPNAKRKREDEPEDGPSSTRPKVAEDDDNEETMTSREEARKSAIVVPLTASKGPEEDEEEHRARRFKDKLRCSLGVPEVFSVPPRAIMALVPRRPATYQRRESDSLSSCVASQQIPTFKASCPHGA